MEIEGIKQVDREMASYDITVKWVTSDTEKLKEPVTRKISAIDKTRFDLSLYTSIVKPRIKIICLDIF